MVHLKYYLNRFGNTFSLFVPGFHNVFLQGENLGPKFFHTNLKCLKKCYKYLSLYRNQPV